MRLAQIAYVMIRTLKLCSRGVQSHLHVTLELKVVVFFCHPDLIDPPAAEYCTYEKLGAI